MAKWVSINGFIHLKNSSTTKTIMYKAHAFIVVTKSSPSLLVGGVASLMKGL